MTDCSINLHCFFIVQQRREVADNPDTGPISALVPLLSFLFSVLNESALAGAGVGNCVLFSGGWLEGTYDTDVYCLPMPKVEESTRQIDAFNRSWIVRSGWGGPGPNVWSDAENAVFVDGDGSLHLVARANRDTSGTTKSFNCTQVLSPAPFRL